MKFAGIFVSALALTGALSAAPVLAQDAAATFTINGIAVPGDQVDAVKAKCDELRTGNMTASTATGADPAAAANDSLAKSTDASSVTDPNANPNPATGNAAGGSSADTSATIDIAGLTLDQCEAGGFKAAM